MKPEFLNLLNQNINNSYIKYIEAQVFNNNLVKERFVLLLKSSDYDERVSKWNKILLQNPDLHDKKLMSNPYYIGYGNPNADILFVGLEKAIDLDNSGLKKGININYTSQFIQKRKDVYLDLFFQESINNIFHFNQFVNNNLPKNGHYSIRFPSRLSLQRLKELSKLKKHTKTSVPVWQNYSKYIASTELNDIKLFKKLHDEVETYEESFCSKCFMTELFHEPSAKHNNNVVLNSKRAQFLIDNSNFFKSFKTIFFTGKKQLPKNIIIDDKQLAGIDFIKNVFDVDNNNLDILKTLIDDVKDFNEIARLIKNDTINFYWRVNNRNEVERILFLTKFWGNGQINDERIKLFSRISTKIFPARHSVPAMPLR